ncbi:carboxypeptidase-like regulatory domain-containing protein [Marivirga salinae]|uniref:Carboxypeptidase-like regulatory domain-containing protein n=1 Tax=Marivirga salinarum TaxID=3059078 RepID=A0AA51RE56_9BACT|nr:carboxypeptidase-like regulatory domain-containing protein [Marivirga sp. BDSF4-3]WMN11010.1 carboxypeptidase-like regulatory domain-containing protein [Marivirga sp. BDSF4-3]
MQRNSINRNLLFFFLLFIGSSCIEDTIAPTLVGSLDGVLVDKLTNTPIEAVEISTVPVTSEAYTDSAGIFQIENMPIGEYTLVAKATGYANENVKITITNNNETTVTVKLTAANRIAPPPINPFPDNSADNQPLSISLQWQAVDLTYDDLLAYNIIVYEDDDNEAFIEIIDHQDTSLVIDGLKYNSNYFWQVNVTSSTGNVTKGDIWSFKTIAFPDNRYLFSSLHEGNYEIFSSDNTGETLTRITNTSNMELKPLYSKTRDLIAYSSNRQVDFHIYTMAKDGSGSKKVTTLPIAGFHNQGTGYCWSPDNGKFLYSHYDMLYQINKDGTTLRKVAIAPINRNFRTCDWTDVNNKIVVETIGSTIYSSEIYLMNSDGTDTMRLVDDLPGIMENPSFSVDGNNVIFTRDQSGYESATGRQLDARIFNINIETLEITDLSDGKTDGTNDLQPRFSPDGAKIIFVNVANDGSGFKSVWIMDTDGKNREKLFENAEMPNWE